MNLFIPNDETDVGSLHSSVCKEKICEPNCRFNKTSPG